MEERRSRNRIYLFMALCIALFAVAALRQAWLSLGLGRGAPSPATVREERGAIYDRKGRPLALSLERYHIYLNTRKALSDKAYSNLESALSLTAAEWDRMRHVPKTWLLRKFVTREQAEQVRKVRSDGILVERVYQRQYPQGPLLAHVLGYTGFDGDGIAGLERQYHGPLSGRTRGPTAMTSRSGSTANCNMPRSAPWNGASPFTRQTAAASWCRTRAMGACWPWP